MSSLKRHKWQPSQTSARVETCAHGCGVRRRPAGAAAARRGTAWEYAADHSGHWTEVRPACVPPEPAITAIAGEG